MLKSMKMETILLIGCNLRRPLRDLGVEIPGEHMTAITITTSEFQTSLEFWLPLKNTQGIRLVIAPT